MIQFLSVWHKPLFKSLTQNKELRVEWEVTRTGCKSPEMTVGGQTRQSRVTEQLEQVNQPPLFYSL